MLTLVPTPIGNLGDITYRAVQVLQEAEIFLCEDTRVAKKLLCLLSKKLNISFKSQIFISFHSHTDALFFNNTLAEKLKTTNAVYISDAGMPCISDPGAELVAFCLEHNISYDVLPGPSSPVTAFAMSGFCEKEFAFFGFLHNKGLNREADLARVMQTKVACILFESPRRIKKLIGQIAKIEPERVLFAVKEMTKIHQKIFKAKALEVYESIENINLDGEWIVIIEPAKQQNISGELLCNDPGATPKERARVFAKAKGISSKKAYSLLLEEKKEKR